MVAYIAYITEIYIYIYTLVFYYIYDNLFFFFSVYIDLNSVIGAWIDRALTTSHGRETTV